MAKITETILRDAHQSLIATRMRTEDMLEGARLLDKVGYFSAEMWGGATFDVCIRFLNEDPWERLRKIKAAMPNTPMQMLLRGQNLVGYKHYSDDVVDLFVQKAAENGIDIFRIFDALNDLQNMERAIKAVNKAGKHAQGAISYTKSPVHTVEGFIDVAKGFKELGCQSIAIKDMAGLLMPADARELIPAIKKAVGLPIAVHSHNTAGYAQAMYYAAIEAGADTVDCALSPLSNGTSQPPTESMIAALAGTPWDTGYNLEQMEEITSFFKGIRDKYQELLSPISERVDTRVIRYQVPGGMISNLVSQLEKQKKLDKLEEVLAEVPRVRKDVGYVPLVTPTSQIVGTQAVFNVLAGERYKMVTNETKNLVLNKYGRTPAPISQEIIDKVGGGETPITCRPADLLEPTIPGIRAKYADIIKKEEDVLTLALYPEVAEKFLRGDCKAEIIPDTPATPAAPGAAASAVTGPRAYDVVVDGSTFHVEVHPSTGATTVRPAAPAAAPAAPAAAAPVAVSGNAQAVKAPMQGAIMKIKANVGDTVARGDVLGVLEAMKMENDIMTPFGGKVVKILVTAGQSVEAEQDLFLIEG